MKSLRVSIIVLLFTSIWGAGASARAQGRGPGGQRSSVGRGGMAGPSGVMAPTEPGGPKGRAGATPNSGAANGGGRTANAPHNALQFGPPGRWWDDRSVVRSVGLRSEQQKKMDGIFDANKQAILSTYKNLLNEQAKLAALNKSTQPDKNQVFAQIDAVSQARAALQKATTQMLLQVREQMDPAQIDKLEQIQ